MMMRNLLMGSLFVVGLAALNCSGGNEGSQSSDVTSACSTICSHEASCNSSIDQTTCESGCASQGLVRSAWRSDFTANLTSCFAGSSCADVTKSFNDCISQAALAATPDAQDQTFCSSLVSAAQSCGASLSLSDCTNLTAVFSDASLAAAQACTSESCADDPGCVAAALPGYS